MSMKTKYIIISIIWVFTLLLTAYGAREAFPKINEVPVVEQKSIDENTWVSRAKYSQRGNLLDSLNNRNRELYKALKDRNEEIASLVQVNGELDIKNDSLKTHMVELTDSLGKERKYVFKQSFVDSLLEVKSVIRLSNTYLKNNLYLEQLRPMKIDVATTIADKKDYVLTYVSSEDLKVDYTSETALKRDKFSKWEYAGYGAITGAVLTLILTR